MENSYEERIKILEKAAETTIEATGKHVEVTSEMVSIMETFTSRVGDRFDWIDNTFKYLLRTINRIIFLIFEFYALLLVIIYRKEIFSLCSWLFEVIANWFYRLSENWQIAVVSLIFTFIFGILCVLLGFWLAKRFPVKQK